MRKSKTGLSPHVIYIIDRSKAILLLWFYMFNVLEYKFCGLNIMYVFIVLVKFG